MVFSDRGDEPAADAAQAVLQAVVVGERPVLQPPHFLAEVCTVLARESPQSMADNLRDLLDLAIPVRADAAVYARAMALSEELGHHLERWATFFGGVRRGDAALLAMAAAHQRLGWIHPFVDGNGRVMRLHTHTLLSGLALPLKNVLHS